MQLNYTENARQVLRLAEKAAKQGGHRYIGSEHLLTALVQEQEGTAGAILRSCGRTTWRSRSCWN